MSWTIRVSISAAKSDFFLLQNAQNCSVAHPTS